MEPKLIVPSNVTYSPSYQKKTVKNVKRSVQSHVFAQSPPGWRPNDKYPVNTSHRSDLCKYVSLQCSLVATIIHTQSVHRYVCIYTHIVHSIETVVRQKKLKKRDSSECRVPRKFFRAPQVGQPRLRRKDILTGSATTRYRPTLHCRDFGSPKPTGFKLAVGRSAISTAHLKSPLVLQEPMLPIS